MNSEVENRVRSCSASVFLLSNLIVLGGNNEQASMACCRAVAGDMTQLSLYGVKLFVLFVPVSLSHQSHRRKDRIVPTVLHLVYHAS